MTAIKSIMKGWGEGSEFYATSEQYKGNHCHVDRIRCEEEFIGKGVDDDLTIMMYSGYIEDRLIFKIEANSSLTITYKE
jgi:hypothetical protein